MLKCEGYKMFRGTGVVKNIITGATTRTETGDWLYKPEYDCWYVNGSSFPAECMTVINDETEPVRHGRWIDTGSGQECSICKEIQYGYDSGRYYCPNCGTVMDGGQDEYVK